jgi:simple sugar transport system permease protein
MDTMQSPRAPEIQRMELPAGSPRFLRPEFGVVIGIVVIWAFFFIMSSKFLWLSNLGNISTAAAEMGIIAVGMAFLIISGEFDLSVGSVYAITPIVMFRVAQWLAIPVAVAFVLAMLLAGIIGFCNGFIILRFKLPSFIVTMATMMLLSGIILAVTGGFITEHKGRPLFFDILAKRIGDFRVSTLWMIGIVVVFAIVLDKTRYGNWVYATGGNTAVALKMGVKVARVKITNFIICSMLAGFSGCVGASRVYSVNPSVGLDLMFDAMAAGIIGGCLITGGRGSIIGTFLGVILLSSVNSGLILAGASPYWYRAFVGAIILAVVLINLLVNKRVRE